MPCQDDNAWKARDDKKNAVERESLLSETSEYHHLDPFPQYDRAKFAKDGLQEAQSDPNLEAKVVQEGPREAQNGSQTAQNDARKLQ